ncbi:MAG TPA: lipase maturation factor family protein [Polyangiaceae bacterium]|jgi:hypothetical protein
MAAPGRAMDAPLPLEPALLDRWLARPVPALWARWIFLRALGVLFLSAFVSLAPSIHGLIGPHGIRPATELLTLLAGHLGPVKRIWAAPSFLWFGAGDGALTTLVVVGSAASLSLVFNVAPRAALVACELAFLSFVAVGQEFAMYQSDGMLLEAGFVSFFFAPRGLRPRLGPASPPTALPLFLLRWESFRIYFESGLGKVMSHDPQWAHLTAMDRYYENGPLPTWIAWYAQQLPHWVHAATCILMFVMELGVPFLAWLGSRARRVCFAIVTPFQIGIILTANYAFLNYLVLSLGVLLLDDSHFARFRWKTPPIPTVTTPRWRVYAAAVPLGLVLYVTVLSGLGVPRDTLLGYPVELLETVRIANSYGLFARMTEARYELEFQGSKDGVTWVPYPYRYKPQAVNEHPGLYAPLQPRFDWNLWFVPNIEGDSEWILDTELRLLQGEAPVLALFRDDPFHGELPKEVRIVEWQYWFTTWAERKQTGAWWRRKWMGVYAPAVGRGDDGRLQILRGE